MALKPYDLRRRLYVIFRGEEGLDYGGLARSVSTTHVAFAHNDDHPFSLLGHFCNHTLVSKIIPDLLFERNMHSKMTCYRSFFFIASFHF